MKGEGKEMMESVFDILVRQPGIWAMLPGAGQESCSWSDYTNIWHSSMVMGNL